MPKKIIQNDTFQMGFDNPALNACVGNNGFIDLYTYQCGYYEATLALINKVKISMGGIDQLIYPIAYSARHTIEIFLKNQLYKLKYISAKATGNEFESKLINTHSINDLWTDFLSLTSLDDRYKKYTDKLHDYILDFVKIDDTGETFRYPFDHEDDRHLTELYCINITIFETRFNELYEIIDDIGYLTDFLVSEYSVGTVIMGLSRDQIKKIALSIPNKENWGNEEFVVRKKELLEKYLISSNTFSKVLNLIQGHYEFSSFIGIEIKLEHISCDELKKYIKYYNQFHNEIGNGNYIEIKENIISLICDEISPDAIKSLSALFDIEYFHYFPESYIEIFKEKTKLDINDILFSELLDRRIVLDKIKLSLERLGQKTLLQEFEQ